MMRSSFDGDDAMWTAILLLFAITVLYAGYNLLVKVSTLHVPAAATSTVLATICLQVAALAASCIFALWLLARGGHALKLSPAAYGWAAGAGLCIGVAEIAYFYLFRGVGGAGPVAANVAVPVIVTGAVVLTMLLSYLALKESLSAMQVAGTGVVIIGIAMIFLDGFSART
ncbi:MAG: hypothetical protein OXC25_09685 [Thiotrichales bacterium]|nr:hypothetical protein [Thiotrichales bacterium]MCY4350102.1 hypothetical protein [Thiotrichales bacterium]